MAEKKYKVADDTALVVKGVVLKPGEAIPDGALDSDTIKTLTAAKKIVEDKDAAEKAADEKAKKKAEEEAKKAEAEAKKKAEEEAARAAAQGGGQQQ